MYIFHAILVNIWAYNIYTKYPMTNHSNSTPDNTQIRWILVRVSNFALRTHLLQLQKWCVESSASDYDVHKSSLKEAIETQSTNNASQIVPLPHYAEVYNVPWRCAWVFLGLEQGSRPPHAGLRLQVNTKQRHHDRNANTGKTTPKTHNK